MQFSSVDIDNSLQTAEMKFRYGKENVVYIISTTYTDASYGIDVEDKITDQYYKEKKGQEIEIKEYQVKGTNEKRYSASYKYNGIEYFLIGTMTKQEFELVIDNLHFNI